MSPFLEPSILYQFCLSSSISYYSDLLEPLGLMIGVENVPSILAITLWRKVKIRCTMQALRRKSMIQYTKGKVW